MDKTTTAAVKTILKDYVGEDTVDETVGKLCATLGSYFYNRFVEEMEKRNYIYNKETGVRQYTNRDINDAALIALKQAS